MRRSTDKPIKLLSAQTGPSLADLPTELLLQIRNEITAESINTLPHIPSVLHKGFYNGGIAIPSHLVTEMGGPESWFEHLRRGEDWTQGMWRWHDDLRHPFSMFSSLEKEWCRGCCTLKALWFRDKTKLVRQITDFTRHFDLAVFTDNALWDVEPAYTNVFLSFAKPVGEHETPSDSAQSKARLLQFLQDWALPIPYERQLLNIPFSKEMENHQGWEGMFRLNPKEADVLPEQKPRTIDVSSLNEFGDILNEGWEVWIQKEEMMLKRKREEEDGVVLSERRPASTSRAS
ncbi:hypothetical protein T439DRAFT_325370 [Meredithblackwellia eburnea MCA 4105]